MEGYWSLVGFTILAQTAAGIMIWSPVAGPKADSCMQAMAALVLLGAGALCSLAHLSAPEASFYTIFNVLDSWLSREIACLGLFGAATLLVLIKKTAPLQWLAAAAGLLLVIVMGNVYTIQAVNAWNSCLTVIAFVCATLILGASANFCLALLRQRGNETHFNGVVLGWYPALITLAMAARLAVLPLQALRQDPAKLCLYGLVTQVLLTLLGVSLATLFVTRSRLAQQGGTTCSASLALAGTLLIVAAEVIGRALFYAGYMTFGLG